MYSLFTRFPVRSVLWMAAGLFLLGAAGVAVAQAALPPLEKDAKARLEASPRHGEWVSVEATRSTPGSCIRSARTAPRWCS